MYCIKCKKEINEEEAKNIIAIVKIVIKVLRILNQRKI